MPRSTLLILGCRCQAGQLFAASFALHVVNGAAKQTAKQAD
jgi:hypothetical protein